MSVSRTVLRYSSSKNGVILNDIIQRQITQNRYNIQLYLQWRTNKKSCYLSYGAVFNDLEQPL